MAKAERKTDKKADSYYTPVKGSRELVTTALSDDDLQGIENLSGLSKKQPVRLYAGEWLGRTEVDEGASVPLDVFDSLASSLTPLEQAVFYQLIRLSLGEGRNFCRVGKRELISRTGISERRLLVALDGLVRKERIRPLHRNNFGTLYRVYMTGESPAAGSGKGKRKLTAKTSRVSRGAPEIEGDTYYVDSSPSRAKSPSSARSSVRSKAKTIPDQKAPKPRTGKSGKTPPRSRPAVSPRSRPLESPLNEERFAGTASAKAPLILVGNMVKEFFRAVKRKPSTEDKDEAVSEITALLEDGYTRAEVLEAVRWFGKHFPEERGLSRLPYFIHEALSEGKEKRD